MEAAQKKGSSKKLSKLVGTFFRNALRSNLDLTSLADTKAGILISINGFILTVSVTASGFAVHNSVMTYAFISIILTSLGSIIFAVLAVKPRAKKELVKKEHLDGYSSLLYYQDMADLSPDEYSLEMNRALCSTRESKEEMISHLHILGTEIKKKYFWLKQAYTYFSIGLIVSASFIIYALVSVEKTAFYNLSKGNVVYTENRFYNVFEPSGATTMPDGKVLIVEDESNSRSLKLLEIQSNGSVAEIGNLYLPKKIKKKFKKGVEDLEAITSDGNTVYAITSHSLTRENKQRASREKFIMFKYSDGAIEEFYSYKNLKQDLYKHFGDYFKKSLFLSETINIEGLTMNGEGEGILIAFRSPLADSDALLINLKNPKELFLKGAQAEFGAAIRVDLKGLGIRDITYDDEKKGYWIIAGGTDNRENKFELWFWDRKNSSVQLVKNQPNIGYGEGITVVNAESDKSALFIVEDNGKKPNKAAKYIMIDKGSL